jgi:hypothetical protein
MLTMCIKFGPLMFSVFRGHGVKKLRWDIGSILAGKHEQDKKMYRIKEQTKSRYSSLNSMFVSL